MSAQHAVDARHLHDRIWAIVPLVGKGTWDDPKRPLFAPNINRPTPGPLANIAVSWTYQTSDDGLFALVEFVAQDLKLLNGVINDKTPGVRVFVKGKDDRATLEREFRKLKKDFSLDRFGIAAQ